MDEQNIIHRMLAKGDSLRPAYKDFDFSQLDSTQQKYLNKLTLFSKHRERIIRKFNSTRITYDVKIAFLDQHSMKLGNNIFYDLESKRQDYIGSIDFVPFTTLVSGFVFFCGFAMRTPMTSKLYKELGYSLILGGALSYTYVYYYKKQYLYKVDEIYDKLKLKFATNPAFSTIKEDQQIIKNFGFNKYNDADTDEQDLDAEDEGLREIGIFEGNPNDDRNEFKDKILGILYGGEK